MVMNHGVITSGSPTDRFESCGSGTQSLGIWFPECGGHVPSRQNFSFLRGRRLGGPEPGGRARPRVTGGPQRLAGVLPSVGPGCCPGHRWKEPPRIVGARSPGARGYASSPCGGHGGMSGGAAAWPGRDTLTVHGGATRGAPSMAPPRPLWGCPAGLPGGVIQGEWPAERRCGRRVGAPASTQGPIKAG